MTVSRGRIFILLNKYLIDLVQFFQSYFLSGFTADSDCMLYLKLILIYLQLNDL